MTTTTTTPAPLATAAPVNREDWLRVFAGMFRARFEAIEGVELPDADKLRFSCGWTSTGRRSTRIGEHWGPASSADGAHEIFISPRLDNVVEVGQTLVHELVHAAIFPNRMHGADFRRVALAVGLAGHMRSTHAGEELRSAIETVAAAVGPYPHAKLDASRLVPPAPPQQNRQLLCWCTSCGYKVRAARGWLDLATPLCPMGHGSMIRQDTLQAVIATVSTDSETGMPTLTRTTTTPVAAPVAPEMIDAPFTPAAWVLRAAAALGGELLELSDVDAFVMLECTNAQLARETDVAATAATVQAADSGTSAYTLAGDGSSLAELVHGNRPYAMHTSASWNDPSKTNLKIKRPGRMTLASALRDLIERGFCRRPLDDDGAEIDGLFCLTDKGRTDDPDGTPEQSAEQTAAAVAARANRFAAAVGERFVPAPTTSEPTPAQRAVEVAEAPRSNRFANLEIDDVEPVEPVAPAPRRRRALEIDDAA